MLFASVLLQKTGHAIAFVLLYRAARASLRDRWLVYAAIWWLLFALDEVGMALGPWQSWAEAAGGILAETIYFPAPGWATARLLETPTRSS